MEIMLLIQFEFVNLFLRFSKKNMKKSAELELMDAIERAKISFIELQAEKVFL